MKTTTLLAFLLLFFCAPSLKAQLKDFEISEMQRPDVAIVQANTAFPEDALIIVYSSLDNLSFRSSMGAIDKQNYNTVTSRYELLIKPIKQMLFVVKPGFLELKLNTLNPNAKDVIYFKVEGKHTTVFTGKGTLEINSNPQGAEIYINNLKLSDKTPASFEYPAGTANVRLLKSGYIDKDSIISIKENNKLIYDFKLQRNLPRVETIAIESISSNAAIYSGKVISNGGSAILEQGICWSKNPDPTLADNSKKLSFETNSFSGLISELSSNTTYYFRAFATNNNGTSYGNEVTIKTLIAKGSGYVSDIDGNVYKTINIGDQVWMAENLKTSHYSNGNLIPQLKSEEKWSNFKKGAWCNYGNYNKNNEIYGKLYNWYAVDNPRNVCPTGWHVPSDNEWGKLIDYLGGEEFAGGKMKTKGSQYWNSPNINATNDCEFSGISGGSRDNDGKFGRIGIRGIWWSSSEYDADDANFLHLFYQSSFANRTTVNKQNGFSIRCIKD